MRVVSWRDDVRIQMIKNEIRRFDDSRGVDIDGSRQSS